jgi:hypothetical protein
MRQKPRDLARVFGARQRIVSSPPPPLLFSKCAFCRSCECSHACAFADKASGLAGSKSWPARPELQLSPWGTANLRCVIGSTGPSFLGASKDATKPRAKDVGFVRRESVCLGCQCEAIRFIRQSIDCQGDHRLRGEIVRRSARSFASVRPILSRPSNCASGRIADVSVSPGVLS